MCSDIVGQIGDGVITLPICSPTDTFSLRRAYVEVSTDAASYSLSSLDTQSVDLLAPGGCFCTLKDDEGREYRYELILDYSGRHIPVVSVDTAAGQGIWSRDEYTDAVVSIDAEGVDAWYLPAGFSSLAATGVSIKGRGNFTWEWPKKPYKLKFPAKTPILGLTAAKKWVLFANYSDYSLMRNYVAMEASKVLSPETSPLSQYPVDLFVNGEYVGVYTIGEDHNAAAGRIELPKTTAGTTFPSLSRSAGMRSRITSGGRALSERICSERVRSNIRSRTISRRRRPI